MVFPFYSLPPEAREMVLEYVDVESKLKLMGINDDLRGYVLKNGPFPKNVDFMLVDSSNLNTLVNGKICTPVLLLRIECGKEYNFIVRRTGHLSWKVLNYELRNLMLKPSHLRIFKSIKFPKNLELRFDSYNDYNDEMIGFLGAEFRNTMARSFFGLEELLSKFRLLQKLSISVDAVRIADAVFKHLKPSVLGTFNMQFVPGKAISRTGLELDFYTEHFRSYLQNQLAESAVICLPCLPTSAISFFEAFSQTNVKKFCFEKVTSPVEVVKFILNNGIPSKFDKAAIRFSGVVDHTQKIIPTMLKTAGMTVINPESWAGMKAIERCLKISDQDDVLNNEIKMKPDFIFEHQLSSTKKCTFLLKYVRVMEFVAKNSPIVS